MNTDDLHWHCYLSSEEDAPLRQGHEWLLEGADRIAATFYEHHQVSAWMLDKRVRHAPDMLRPSFIMDGIRRGEALHALKVRCDVVWIEPRLQLSDLVIAAICCPNRHGHPCPLVPQDQQQST